MISFDDFLKVDIRIGTVIKAEEFKKARRPAYKIWVDFGESIGIKKTSAQVTDQYSKEDLIGKQIVGVINFEVKQIADFMSEFLILGSLSKDGVILLEPNKKAGNGDKIG